jgi:predicted hotdog family 3-hydroxylacyl-ACP dehydratase
MSPRSISADEIYARIPHSGAMRLLDAVLSWDDQSIVCSASSHVDPANPLRDNGVISSVHALEYAAQAMAVHGSLLAPDDRNARLELVYVATFRGVEIHPGALDERENAILNIVAKRVASLPNGWNYEFSVASEEVVLARGKTVVVVPGVAT